MPLPDFLVPIASVALIFAASMAWPHARKYGKIALSSLWPHLRKHRRTALAIAAGIAGFWALYPLAAPFFQREDAGAIFIASAFILVLCVGFCRFIWELREVLAAAFIFILCGGFGLILGGMIGVSFFRADYAAIAGLCGMLFGGMFALALTIAASKK